MAEEEHIISMLVNNKPGVLSRVSGVFGRLGYNIKSLCVAETTDPAISRITLSSIANSHFTEKVAKQLNKLVDVIDVAELKPATSVEREMTLIGIRIDKEKRAEIMRAVDMFGCNVRYMSDNYCILECVGETEKTETIINYLRPLGIEEIARTGIIALPKKTE